MNNLEPYEYIQKGEIADLSGLNLTYNIKINQGKILVKGTKLTVTVENNQGTVEARGINCRIEILSGSQEVKDHGIGTFINQPAPRYGNTPAMPTLDQITKRRYEYSKMLPPGAVRPNIYQASTGSGNPSLIPKKKPDVYIPPPVVNQNWLQTIAKDDSPPLRVNATNVATYDPFAQVGLPQNHPSVETTKQQGTLIGKEAMKNPTNAANYFTEM